MPNRVWPGLLADKKRIPRHVLARFLCVFFV